MVEIKLELWALCNVKPGGRQREAVHLPVQGAGGPPPGWEDYAVSRYVQHSLQCCRSGSMTFWYRCGSGSADPCLWIIDPNPDPGGPKTSGSATQITRYHFDLPSSCFSRDGTSLILKFPMGGLFFFMVFSAWLRAHLIQSSLFLFYLLRCLCPCGCWRPIYLLFS